MLSASVRHEFDLPIEVLWDLIGDFGDMGKWTGMPPEACVADGQGVGALRTLTLPTGGIIVDRLDAQTRYSYAYSIINMEEAPLPFSTYRARLAAETVSGSRSRIDWVGEFEARNLSDDETVDFAQNMYQQGLNMMIRAAAKL